ncbi:hypothetical protein V1511DRAFT_332323 [Dipodascopsis uninucleata]
MSENTTNNTPSSSIIGKIGRKNQDNTISSILASKFAVSIAQSRLLISSWLDKYEDRDVDEQPGASSLSQTQPKVEHEEEQKNEQLEFSKRYTVINGKGGIGTPTTVNDEKPSANAFRQRKTLEFLQKQARKRQSGLKSLDNPGSKSNKDSVKFSKRAQQISDDDYEEEQGRTSMLGKASNKRPATNQDSGNDEKDVRETFVQKRKLTNSILDDLIAEKQRKRKKKKKN